VARETLPDLAYQLSSLLSDIDAAVRARLPERRGPEPARHDKGLRGTVAATLRWLARSAGRQPPIPRARSIHERPRRSRRRTP
jgi:hypothetical protein